MGKYSIDSFEQYRLTKLRPAVMKAEKKAYRLLELSKSELEPENGELLSPPELASETCILRLCLCSAKDAADACGFIRRIGSFYEGGKHLAGVVMTAGKFSATALEEIAKAYIQGFESTFLLAEPGSELMETCRKLGVQPGLWLPVSEGILPLRRKIAENNLERVWRTKPVYIHAGRSLTPEETDAACRWHTSGADVPAELGSSMTLRRVMFPGELTSGGVMPLRVWLQNIGTAPVYHDAKVRMELGREEERFAISIPGFVPSPGLGDTTFNVNAQLPKLPGGTYDLWAGLEVQGKCVPLAIDAECVYGMYRIGEVTLDDTSRPYLETMWEEQYADGYYPLEDPAQPE